MVFSRDSYTAVIISLFHGRIFFQYLLVFATFLTMTIHAENGQHFVSNETPLAFLELYTSQGCSSCPRAEQWLNDFIDHESLWKEIIPVNFHVDYWDYLGWKDPYAFSEFSRRQRSLKALGNTRVVATPGFILNGSGWSGWFIRQPLPVKQSGSSVGTLTVKVNDGEADIQFVPEGTPGKSKLTAKLVLLGFDQETDVPRGENKGHKLTHHFVAIGYRSQSLNLVGSDYATSIKVPLAKKFHSPRKAIVVWIEKDNGLEPLQVVGGWL